jgi:hypothetical protein
MRLKTVLNRVQPVEGFVYEKARLVEDEIEISMRPHRRSRPVCAGCGRRGPGYDTLPVRRFAFVPLWSLAVVLLSARRRVDRPRCGVTAELLPWADGKHRLTHACAVFLARWARRLGWREVAGIFRTSWESVFRTVAWVVEYGLAHRDWSGITAIGVDEVQFQKGHRYLTAVYQIDSACRGLLWIGPERTAKTLLRFFRMLGRQRTAALQFVRREMWQPYRKVSAKKAGQTITVDFNPVIRQGGVFAPLADPAFFARAAVDPRGLATDSHNAWIRFWGAGHILRDYFAYYHEARTQLSLDRNAPLHSCQQGHKRIDVAEVGIQTVAVDVAVFRRAVGVRGLPGAEIGQEQDERVDVGKTY